MNESQTQSGLSVGQKDALRSDKIASELLGQPVPSRSQKEPDGRSERATGPYLRNPVLEGYLHNQQLPNSLLKHEKPEHRIMLFLKGQGMSNREVAQCMDYSDGQVSQITRQAWFISALKDYLESEGRDLIKTVLEGEGKNSIFKLVEIRDDKESPKSVIVQACNSILDRWLGKPKQAVEVTTNKGSATPADAAKLDEEIKRLEVAEKELTKIAKNN